MALKTRDRLIEVARQLFARKGVANTTMNDIAEASEKGRRTIYTYFRNKKEIYNAVLETESDRMVTSLRAIAQSSEPAEECLRRFLLSRLEHGRTIGSAYSSLIAWLKFDLKRMERIHKLVSDKERSLLESILDRGIREGCFDAARCQLLRGFIERCFNGLDLSNIDSPDTGDHRLSNTAFVEFVVTDIVKKP